MMSYLTSHIRAGSRLVAILCLSLFLAGRAQAQFPTLPAVPTSCSYTTAPATVSLTASNVPVGFSTVYLLVDMVSGTIVKTNSSAPVFSSVPAGNYYAVAAHYTGSINNASAGGLISQVYAPSQCLTYGTPLALKVCNSAGTCDFTTSPSNITFTASNVPTGVNTTYVLTDESTNTIVRTSTTASFSNVTQGDYAITSIHYTGSLTALAAGNKLYDIATASSNCLSVSQSLHIRVCNSPIVITSPGAGSTVTTLNPTISGTATAGSSVTVTGSAGSTGGPCITTANSSGLWSCSSLTFTAGLTSVTATDGSTTAVRTFNVNVPVNITTTLTVDPIVPGPTTQPISGTATPGSVVSITGPGNVTLCTTTASASSAFSCTVTVPTGPTTLTVTASGPGGTVSQPVNTTGVAAPTVTVTGPSGIQTSTSPTVSGTATPGSVVSITGPGNVTLCTTTATAGGNFSCTVSVATGPLTLTVSATNPGGTASTTTSFTAAGQPVLIIDPVVPRPPTQPISGTASPGAVVIITGPGNVTLCTTTASASGTFTCTITVPTGPSSISVTAVGPGGVTTTPVTTTGVAAPTVTVTGPSGIQTTTSPTVSGTATPGSVVSITGPGNVTLCTTTATAGGNFSCTVSVATGPLTLTVSATNPGGTASTTTSFTATGVPALVVSPPVPGPTTQPISGTASPGAVVIITGPGNVTLCTTTASASGTFSCPVTVPTGPSSVSVTAVGPGGATTVPVTTTGVAAPTVTVTGPSGIQTTTSPTVSGTATPGSVVSITGPGNVTLCTTTATTGGSFSCTVSVVSGPLTLTVTATNAGGRASTTTSFTALTTIQVSLRALLQGALTSSVIAGRMRDDLRSKNLIPTQEPYSALGFTQLGGGGGETIPNPTSVLSVTGSNAIVDWIFVELRNASNPGTVVATRSGLIQVDGDIVDVNGVSPLTFSSNLLTAGGSYYVAIRHRNHLGVMTASPISTSGSVPVVDFSNPATATYMFPVGNSSRSTAPQALENGFSALWAGNTYRDAYDRIILQGPDNDVDPIFFDVLVDPNNVSGFTNYVRNNVYSTNDIDMDGRVIFQGPNNEIDNIFFEILTHPDNTNQYINFVIRGQLP